MAAAVQGQTAATALSWFSWSVAATAPQRSTKSAGPGTASSVVVGDRSRFPESDKLCRRSFLVEAAAVLAVLAGRGRFRLRMFQCASDRPWR